MSLTCSTTSGVMLTAEMDGVTPATSSRSRSVTVVGPGAGIVALLARNQDNLDRGLCLIVGAGEAAGRSFGDLITTAGLPAYRTLGRDRPFGLHYNSATATGLNLIAARVAQPATIAMPASMRVVLAVNGTHYDSTTYSPRIVDSASENGGDSGVSLTPNGASVEVHWIDKATRESADAGQAEVVLHNDDV